MVISYHSGNIVELCGCFEG